MILLLQIKDIDKDLFFEDWEGIIPEILKARTTQDAKLRPLADSPAYTANMQWEEDNLETWLESSDGHPVTVDQCCGTVKEKPQLQ